jgi:hypothetical protein
MRTAAHVVLGLGFGAAVVVIIGLVVGLTGGNSNPFAAFVPLTIMLVSAGVYLRIIGPPIQPGEMISIRRRRRKDSE